jgi:hypothetical protein
MYGLCGSCGQVVGFRLRSYEGTPWFVVPLVRFGAEIKMVVESCGQIRAEVEFLWDELTQRFVMACTSFVRLPGRVRRRRVC